MKLKRKRTWRGVWRERWRMCFIFHSWCSGALCGHQSSCGCSFWTQPNTREDGCVTFAWFARDFCAKLNQSFTTAARAHFHLLVQLASSPKMPLQSSRGRFCLLVGYFSFFLLQWLDECQCQSRAEQRGQEQWSVAKSGFLELLLLFAECPALDVSECPVKVAHATFFTSPWAGGKLQSPSLAALKSSNQAIFRHQKKKKKNAACGF